MVFFLILIAHSLLLLFITGGLFDDMKEAEFVFKYAVRKTHDEQMFNSSMRRLDAGKMHESDGARGGDTWEIKICCYFFTTLNIILL